MKTPMIRSKILRDSAKGQACVNCGVNDGTTVAAHYQGIRSQMYGKGKSIKPHDLFIAHLCATCHGQFDSGKGSFVKDEFQRKVDLSERFQHCVLLTLLRLIAASVLKVDDIKLDIEDE